MRHLFYLPLMTLTLTASAVGSPSVMANDAPPTPYSPWMEEKVEIAPTKLQINDDITPLKISLSDLENLATGTLNRKNQNDTPQEKSTLEDIYSERIIDELSQYGYGLFKDAGAVNITETIPAGSVQGDYRLSYGDSINVTFRGQINKRRTYNVDRKGYVVIDDLAPMLAAGRSLADIENDLMKEVSKIHNTEAFVTLDGVRQVGVLVAGHVDKPGRKTLTAFHTIFDALTLAGGIEKTGSLRQIKLIRNGRSQTIDLYQLLIGSASSSDKLLQDGDRIIVPPIGPTMAIAGRVKRPAIYELQQNRAISLNDALTLAGGTVIPGQGRYIKMDVTLSGNETVIDVAKTKERVFNDGSILMVEQSAPQKADSVTLSGATRQQGTHDLKKSRTLSDLINSEKVLSGDIYPLIGIIERKDKDILTRKLIPFSPIQVLQKQDNQSLENEDEVHLFTMEEINALQNSKPLLTQASLSANEPVPSSHDPMIQSLLQERMIFVRGAVRNEGAFPVSKFATLKNILSVTGGLSHEADQSDVEVSYRDKGRLNVNLNTDNPEKIAVHPGDTVRVNQKFHKIANKTVTILGEVNHPGDYDLMPGDTLFKLLERADGLTAQAYADGTIFSRGSERKGEEARYNARAQSLEMQLAASMQAVGDEKPNPTQVSMTQNLITQLRNATAVGRITVESDPAALTAYPQQDILLEAGDRIYIPKRPSTVRVTGEVLSPAALQFISGKTPEDYIREAGGTTRFADKGRTFVIFPDGSAQPLGSNFWTHEARFIPPGSTIVIPHDPKPFSFLEGATQVAQVLSNLAIAGLYIEAIGDDE